MERWPTLEGVAGGVATKVCLIKYFVCSAGSIASNEKYCFPQNVCLEEGGGEQGWMIDDGD